ncbi:protealysin inhibitor emfourin [Streptomyces sp. SBC-4]|nr:protealysin inhibitor emfourin [Streptomyces sp. SBC-4]MDV5145577.1 protealysin inhibitor emfourin [Streptomyces sp. SBC-4]
MRIRVRRTGGFAGIERSAEVEVEVSDPEWESLANTVLAEGDGDLRGVPDGFSYEITVDDRTVRCCDPRLTDAQRTLIAKVLKEGA